MTPTNRPHKKLWANIRTNITVILIGLLSPFYSHAGKLDLLAGYFDLTAKVGSNEGQVSTFGAYKISYATELFTDNLELELGYTLLMSNTVGGDLAYGIEAAMVYFPFTPSSTYIGKSENASLSINPLWRPFIGLGFGQRQAQSTNSGYAGFGLILGTERAIDRYFDLKALLRYNSLTGPSNATANELVIMFGITFPFSFGSR